MKLLLSSILTATFLSLGSPVSAAIFQFSASDPSGLNGSKRAGKTTEVKASYDTDSDLFKWSSTFVANGKGRTPDGAWLVVNNGPNPKGNTGELAIAYLDEAEGKVSFFEYNGANSANSYNSPGNYLAFTDLNVNKGSNSVTYDFEFDSTDLNNLGLGPNWKGLQFDHEIGIWFHGVDDLHTSYTGDKLTEFIYRKQSWYDVGHKKTEKIPEPSTMFGLFGLAGLGLITKKSK